MVGIRVRIFLSFLIPASIGFYYFTTWIANEVKPRYREATEESLIDTAVILASIIETTWSTDESNLKAFEKAFNNVRHKEFNATVYGLIRSHVDLRVYITDNKGIVIFDSAQNRALGEDYSQWNDVYLTLRGQYGARATRRDPSDPTSTVLYVAAPITINGDIIGSLTVAKSSDNANTFIESAKQKVTFAGILISICVIILVLVVSLWVTSPIKKLTLYAQAIGKGERINLPRLGKNEIGDLGLAFEEMRNTLEGKNYVEQYVQTLTHEIKSPLTAIKGAAELLDENMPNEQRAHFIANIHNETLRIQNLINRLLKLSALETKRELKNISCHHFSDIVAEVLEEAKPSAEAKQITISFKHSRNDKIEGEHFLLNLAVSNIIQNAIVFSPISEVISLSIETVDDSVVLSVIDNGPGIPEYALSKIYDRFYSLERPGTGRKSSGLGLSLVKEIIELHHGSISVINRPNGGCIALISLPKRL